MGVTIALDGREDHGDVYSPTWSVTLGIQHCLRYEPISHDYVKPLVVTRATDIITEIGYSKTTDPDIPLVDILTMDGSAGH